MKKKSARRRFSREFKIAAVRRVLDGEKHIAVARDLEIGPEMLWKWKKVFLEQGAEQLHGPGRRHGDQEPLSREASQQRRIAELERLVGRQQLEIGFLEKALRRVEELRQEKNDDGEAASSKR